MELITLYKCLADEARLRILNLLRLGPLCGCHFVEALAMDQVKISKQLNYMKRHGVLAAEREANWMIYRLADPEHPVLKVNLLAMRTLPSSGVPFAADEGRLAEIKQRISAAMEEGCQPLAPSAVAASCCATH